MTSYVYLVHYVTSDGMGGFDDEFAMVTANTAGGITMTDAMASHPDPLSIIEAHDVLGSYVWSEVTA